MIDWNKPLELMDGTPVRLVPLGHYALELWGGCQPDDGGHWWVEREDGLRFVDGVHTICGDDSGFSFGNKVRNRAEPETVVPEIAYATEEQPTLRDRFAMAALGGLMAGLPERIRESSVNDGNWEFEAGDAYRIADAMMEARK